MRHPLLVNLCEEDAEQGTGSATARNTGCHITPQVTMRSRNAPASNQSRNLFVSCHGDTATGSLLTDPPCTNGQHPSYITKL
ncbi:MAG: hypothetical protein DYG96_00040 [Chlorobi bacterium CHB2]|nr:hypothetical protein [Chlorobi bacterium CHB2]